MREGIHPAPSSKKRSCLETADRALGAVRPSPEGLSLRHQGAQQPLRCPTTNRQFSFCLSLCVPALHADADTDKPYLATLSTSDLGIKTLLRNRTTLISPFPIERSSDLKLHGIFSRNSCFEYNSRSFIKNPPWVKVSDAPTPASTLLASLRISA